MREGRGREPARSAGHRADGAGVVRRRGPRTDGRSRPRRRVRAPHAAGRTAGGVLRLARPRRRRLAQAGERRRPGAGRGRRRRHDRLHADRSRRGGRQPRADAARGRRSPAARRRQHGPDARAPRGAGARGEGHEARRRPDGATHLRLPQREGRTVRRRRSCRAAPVTVLGKGRSHRRRHDQARTDARPTSRRCWWTASSRTARATRRPAAAAVRGLQELGLPYVADAGITRHLASFLVASGRSARDPRRLAREQEEEGSADAVSIPARSCSTAACSRATCCATACWACWDRGRRRRRPTRPASLPGADLDLAVARGAAYYGLVRRGKGVRIRGGTARAYYIGVETTMPAVPGFAPPIKALCVAPFGMEEGTEADIPSHEVRRACRRRRRSSASWARPSAATTRPAWWWRSGKGRSTNSRR